MNTDSLNFTKNSLCGVGRGIFVHVLIYPLDVVKMRQQCSPQATSIATALKILKEEGLRAFYKGLSAQLTKTSMKQIWVWPIMIETPSYLEKYNIGDLSQQAITGFSIATIDAAITTPLEKAKICAALSGKSSLRFLDVYKKNGWQGFATHWTSLSVKWSSALVMQKYLRSKYRSKQQDPLTLAQLAEIGVQMALVIGIISTPFDILNTLKQGKNVNPKDLFLEGTLRKFYKGLPLHILALTIHNIATVVVIDKLTSQAL